MHLSTHPPLLVRPHVKNITDTIPVLKCQPQFFFASHNNSKHRHILIIPSGFLKVYVSVLSVIVFGSMGQFYFGAQEDSGGDSAGLGSGAGSLSSSAGRHSSLFTRGGQRNVADYPLSGDFYSNPVLSIFAIVVGNF